MATKIYTPEEIDNINLGRKAVKGVEYKDTRGYTFVWVEENKLRLKEQGSNVTYNPSATNEATNVQDAIDNINNKIIPSRKKTIVDFGDKLCKEAVYITIIDKEVQTDSVITTGITVNTGRGIDELEFVNFSCSVVSIVAGQSFDVLVTDSIGQAEGKYLLNTLRV